MVCRRLALSSIGVLALIACSADTSGLGGSAEQGESDTATTESEITDESSDNNSEASEAEAGDGDPGDGDPGDGDPGDGDPGDGDPGDGDPTGEEAPDSCGDGIVDSGEECDGTELDGMDCAALGFLKGELACSAQCSFDTAGCVNAVCGDGVIEGSEECDGDNLGGVDCAALGFGDGKPSCNGCMFDTSVCPTLGEGEDCGLITECPNDLHCVDWTCYDGSQGDPCYGNDDCQPGLVCKDPFLGGNCGPP